MSAPEPSTLVRRRSVSPSLPNSTPQTPDSSTSPTRRFAAISTHPTLPSGPLNSAPAALADLIVEAPTAKILPSEPLEGTGSSTAARAVTAPSSGPDAVAGDVNIVSNDANSWWKRQLARYGSIELENRGSVARDHLALERTYLAWLRTSLSFASIGIAVTQLFRLNVATTSGQRLARVPGDGASWRPGSEFGILELDRYANLRALGKPLGLAFIGVGIVVLVLGFHRYFQAQYWIIRGKFPASRGSVTILALTAFLLMVSSLVAVVTVQPHGLGS